MQFRQIYMDFSNIYANFCYEHCMFHTLLAILLHCPFFLYADGCKTTPCRTSTHFLWNRNKFRVNSISFFVVSRQVFLRLWLFVLHWMHNSGSMLHTYDNANIASFKSHTEYASTLWILFTLFKKFQWYINARRHLSYKWIIWSCECMCVCVTYSTFSFHSVCIETSFSFNPFGIKKTQKFPGSNTVHDRKMMNFTLFYVIIFSLWSHIILTLFQFNSDETYTRLCKENRNFSSSSTHLYLLLCAFIEYCSHMERRKFNVNKAI